MDTELLLEGCDCVTLVLGRDTSTKHRKLVRSKKEVCMLRLSKHQNPRNWNVFHLSCKLTKGGASRGLAIWPFEKAKTSLEPLLLATLYNSKNFHHSMGLSAAAFNSDGLQPKSDGLQPIKLFLHLIPRSVLSTCPLHVTERSLEVLRW